MTSNPNHEEALAEIYVLFSLIIHEGMAPHIHWLTQGEELGWVNQHRTTENLKSLKEVSAKSLPPNWERCKTFKMIGLAGVTHAVYASSDDLLHFF